MKKRKLHRALSLLLAAMMVLNVPLTSLASDTALIPEESQMVLAESPAEASEPAAAGEEIALGESSPQEDVSEPEEDLQNTETASDPASDGREEASDTAEAPEEASDVQEDLAEAEPVSEAAEDAQEDVWLPEDAESPDESGLILEDIEIVADPEFELAAEDEPGNGTHVITEAADLPETIKDGETYTLGTDITLSAGQQITTLAGVLDGKGHTITLADKPLAGTVSGTIQNLGVAGNITGSNYSGSMAVTLTGTIRNCCSTVTMNADGLDEVGGLVGTLDGGGFVQNSYFAGELTSMMSMGGIAAQGSSEASSLVNCCYAAGLIPVGYKSDQVQKDDSNVVKKTLAEMQTSETIELLNTELPDTGFYWALPAGGGLPVLVEGRPPVGEVDRTALGNVIERAKELSESDYTTDTWALLQTALRSAESVYVDETATQSTVNAAETALVQAINALMPASPVGLPEDGVISLSSQEDMGNYFSGSTSGKYLVLANDIIIDGSYDIYAKYTAFEGVLDGQGHKIIFKDATGPIFARMEAGAVVQNLGFEGTLSGSTGTTTAPLGARMKGAILNCYSNLTGDNVSGFADSLDGGVISNCFVIGDITGGGPLVKTLYGGSVQNAYWLDALAASSVVGNAKSEEAMKEYAFVNLLNSGCGSNGIAWGQSAEGWPYFGEDQEYEPGTSAWPELPGENTHTVVFTPYSGSASVLEDDYQLLVSNQFVDSFGVAGTFSLKDYELPEGARIEWSVSPTPRNSLAINVDTGDLFVYKNGTGVVTATQINADGSAEALAWVSVKSKSQKMTDIRLLVDGQDVTNGRIEIAGSADKYIQVQAKYEGEDNWIDTANSSFTFTPDEAGRALLYSLTDNFSTIHFKEPGTATVTVTSRLQSELSATVTAVSSYVAVEAVVPALDDGYTIHARNANSDGQESDGRIAYNPLHDYVIVTPANATNASKATVTSSDDTVAYFESGERVYVPKEAGVVTFTASIEDTNPETGETNTVTGSKEVTFRYQNPVTSVSLNGDSEITVASGEKAELPEITVAGACSEDGWSVTEPKLQWSYSAKGIVQITSKVKGSWKRDETAPDNNQYVTSVTYDVIGLSEGTVTVTGTPIDTTNEVAPITLTITVTAGSGEDKDLDTMTSSGSAGALDYIENSHRESGYAYGNEWLVYALLQGGRTLDQNTLDTYYASVVQTVKGWTENQKPTDLERAALALTAMGKDITDVEGVNLAAMIYNSPNLTDGSNELIYALLALDAADISIPSDARWNRSSMLAELLKFQNPVTGGFGLTDYQSAGVDMTAMALQALANYRGRAEVDTAIEKALNYLRGQVQEDFGYGNAESTAQVLLALSLLGIDPASENAGFGTKNWNMITNLLEDYKKADGGFSHLSSAAASSEMATVQVLQALDAYQKSKNGESYWNINGQKLTVTFSLLGDDVHDSDSDGVVHTMANGNLATWIPETEYRVETVATVLDLVELALAENGMTCEKKYSDNYIASITKDGVTLGEFTNGKYSGWKYQLNGSYSELGVKEQALSEGDAVIFCYTDNYVVEDKGETDDGNHSHTCTWDAGKVTTAATCTAAGVKTYTCTGCGATRTESIPAAGHKFGAWTTAAAATVFAAETQTRACSVCGAKETRTYGTKLTPTIKVTASTVKLKTGQSTSKFKVSGLAAGDYVKSWKASNTKLVKVSGKNSGSCKLKAKKKTGKTTLTITLASGLKKKVTVKVQKPAVKTTKITGVTKKVTLKKGKTLKLSPVVSPFTSKQKVTYKSSNKKVAKVTASGKIKALKKGTATITVKSGSITVKCRVKVK